MSRLVRRVRRLIADEHAWLCIYVVIVASATVICVAQRCNNFAIFRAAFEHLLAGLDLYAAYPHEHADLYKYSPTFALIFAPFARLPFALGLVAWNAVNVLGIYAGLRAALPERYRLEAVQLTAIGLVATIDGSQSNGLIAALILFAFAALERDRVRIAAAAIIGGAFIKLFPAAAVALAIPRRDGRRFVASLLAFGAAAAALPLTVTNAQMLVAQYRSWYAMGSVDALDRGASMMRLLHLGAGYEGPNWPIQLAGTALLVLPLITRRARWAELEFRLQFLASLLIYCVIFNHKAEQPSFMIAIVGVAIWYAVSPRAPYRNVLTGSTLASTLPILIAVATSNSTGLSADRALLATSVCCVIVWLTMQGELLDPFVGRSTVHPREFAAVTDEPAV